MRKPTISPAPSPGVLFFALLGEPARERRIGDARLAGHEGVEADELQAFQCDLGISTARNPVKGRMRSPTGQPSQRGVALIILSVFQDWLKACQGCSNPRGCVEMVQLGLSISTTDQRHWKKQARDFW